MHYVIADVHNDNRRFRELLDRIRFGPEDHLFLLGDLFDRGAPRPDPVGVYFTVIGLGRRCTVVAGNHDRWLADYIRAFYGTEEKSRKKCGSYSYNSFALMSGRLTRVDMLELADWILQLPLQVEAELGGEKLLFAHAMTSAPGEPQPDGYYLTGGDKAFYTEGIAGYTSYCGHLGGEDFLRYGGEYLDGGSGSVWRNDRKNVYMMDCGCGFASGRLACLCLETGERFYA